MTTLLQLVEVAPALADAPCVSSAKPICERGAKPAGFIPVIRVNAAPDMADWQGGNPYCGAAVLPASAGKIAGIRDLPGNKPP